MVEYDLLFEEDEPVKCDSCRQVAPLAEFDDFHFCELCSSSLVSKTKRYPRQFPEALALQTVAAVGNLVILRLEARLDRLERLLQERRELDA